MEPLVVLVTTAPVPRRGPRFRAWAASVTLVVVADPVPPGAALADVLTRAGFPVHLMAPDPTRVGSWPQADCVIIDADAAGENLEVLVKTLAAQDHAPRVVVVMRASSVERTALLLAGADDVVPAPVHPGELVARVVGVVDPGVEAPLPILDLGPLVIDRNRRSAELDGEPLTLQPLQYDLLVILAEAADHPVPVPRLLDRCWDAHQVVKTEHLRPQLARLRLALGDRCSIAWISDGGYMLRCAS